MIKTGDVVAPLYTTYRPAGVPLKGSGFVVEHVLPFGLMRLRGVSPLVHQSDFVVVSASLSDVVSTDSDFVERLLVTLVVFCLGISLGAMLF